MKCWGCGEEIDSGERVGFRARCPACDRPAHACRNCAHYDPALYNQCRETMAERVVDKEAQNFCEYFTPSQGPTRQAAGPPGGARAQLEALFGKKTR